MHCTSGTTLRTNTQPPFAAVHAKLGDTTGGPSLVEEALRRLDSIRLDVTQISEQAEDAE